ncbi:MAG: hypothetical protein GX331_09845 [Firmicutes bacterium]|jgi:hypothetical protein|nr:hypothetical protein [Bacillota bacterium]
MNLEKQYRHRIMDASASEIESIAKMLQLLAHKLEITKQWLPPNLDSIPPEKQVLLAIELQKTLAEEIQALTKKERAITKQLEMVQDEQKPCHHQCSWWLICDSHNYLPCPYFKFGC